MRCRELAFNQVVHWQAGLSLPVDLLERFEAVEPDRVCLGRGYESLRQSTEQATMSLADGQQDSADPRSGQGIQPSMRVFAWHFKRLIYASFKGCSCPGSRTPSHLRAGPTAGRRSAQTFLSLPSRFTNDWSFNTRHLPNLAGNGGMVQSRAFRARHIGRDPGQRSG